MPDPLRLTLFWLLTATFALGAEDAGEPGPRGLMFYYTQAGQAAAEQDHAAALQHLKDGLVEIPSSPHLRLGVARTHLTLGDTSACREALEHLARTGARLELASYPPLAPVAARSDFAAVARASPRVPRSPPGLPPSWATLTCGPRASPGIRSAATCWPAA